MTNLVISNAFNGTLSPVRPVRVNPGHSSMKDVQLAFNVQVVFAEEVEHLTKRQGPPSSSTGHTQEVLAHEVVEEGQVVTDVILFSQVAEEDNRLNVRVQQHLK